MTYRVLISAPYFIPVVQEFSKIFAENGVEAITAEVNERLDEEELLAQITDIDGVICGDDRFTARVMDSAPRLKVICKWGTGIDSIDSQAAEERGIKIFRTTNAFTEPVADSIMGYILSFARNIPGMDRQMRQGIWEKIPGRALRESTVGVIGVGNIGRAVLRRTHPFGARLLGNDIRTIGPAEAAELEVQVVSLDDLLELSDFVCVTCELNPTSYHLMGDAQFARMKPTAVLINTSRGPIVDEAALVRALESRQIAGAGLDVFEEEPLPSNSPLRRLECSLLASHNSNSSPEAWQAVHRNTVRMLLDGLKSAS